MSNTEITTIDFDLVDSVSVVENTFNWIAWSPDGNTLAIANVNDHICFWDLATSNHRWQLVRMASAGINYIAWSPDSSIIASGCVDGTIKLQDVKNGQSISQYNIDSSPTINSMAWSSDGNLLAVGSLRKVYLLSLIGNELIHKGTLLEGNKVESLAFKPNSTVLAAVSNFEVDLWDARGEELVSKLADPRGPVGSVAWSPDGKTIVSGSWGYIYVWDSETAMLIKDFKGATDRITSVTFSYDGSFLASASREGIVRIWSCKDWKMCGEFNQNIGEIGGLAFHPSKYILATHDKQGLCVNIWKLNISRSKPMSWENVPVYEHTLPNGEPVKFGLCRTQSQNQPDRELWFVAFKSDLYSNHVSTFVVDKLCTEIEFLDSMGNDLMKWEIICLCRLDEGNEVSFDELATGTTEGGYVRSISGFALDSPYFFSVASVPMRIQKYEQYLTEHIEEYKNRSREWFSDMKKWEKLSTNEQSKMIDRWRRKAAKRVREELHGK